MIEKNIFLTHKRFIKEVCLYGIIGGFCATTDSIAFYLLSHWLNIYLSNIISINIGISLSFFLNTFLNFGVTNNLLNRAIKFFTIGYIGLLLSMIILFIGVDLNNLEEMHVKILSVFIVAAIQFVLNKFITFRENF